MRAPNDREIAEHLWEVCRDKNEDYAVAEITKRLAAAREEGRQEERERFLAIIRELGAFHHVSRWVAPWLAARVSDTVRQE